MSDASQAARFEVVLGGCRPEPLASYLKALAVLRLVGEQKDPDARGSWRGDHFVLRSTLDADALVRFFLKEWRPTPVIAPWNGGSGFYPKDNRKAPDAILAANEPRFEPFVRSIEIARSFVARQEWTERPADEEKLRTISSMRAELPDQALAWLDAAVVLTSNADGGSRLLFPPLLGTGGNDGRLDFSNNFQQRVVEVLTSPSAEAARASLFGLAMPSRFAGVMGQYAPAAGERTNPWDFVFLIEGALLFAGAVTRRFEQGTASVMAFPFHARAASGLGTVTDADEGESRDELWLPLWSASSTLREVRQLFAEGRATVGAGDKARPAASALDFARAVSALGVDRGISAFSRFGFHVRNGLAYFATPLGRFSTQEVPSVRLLDDIDAWYERFRQKAAGKGVPAGVAVAARQLSFAMFQAAQAGAIRPVLLALGDAELALSRALGFAEKSFLRPVPRLSRAWAEAVDDGTVEQRLAAALASRAGIHRRLVPLERGGGFGSASDAAFVFRPRPLVDNLIALLTRESVETDQKDAPPVDSSQARCSLGDIADFIDGRTDDVLLERWLRAFVLVDGLDLGRSRQDVRLPPATFAVLAIVHSRRLGEEQLPRSPGALARACAGDSVGATEVAVRRLSASGRPLPVRSLVEPTHRTRRIAAALAFPLTSAQRGRLESMVLSAVEDDQPPMSDQSSQETA